MNTSLSAHHQKAIEACKACVEACEACLADSRQEGEDAPRSAYVARCQDCAELCRVTAAFLERQSGISPDLCRVCLEACLSCEEECAKLSTEACQRCVDACKRCEEEFRHIA